LVAFLPIVSAQDQTSFPDITFRAFADFVEDNFSSHVTLATVLTVMFTLTNNPDLLNLHGRQQVSIHPGENGQIVTSWMKSLSRAVHERLKGKAMDLLQTSERQSQRTDQQITHTIGLKLDAMSKLLELCPFKKNGMQIKKLKPISDKEIEPILVICPVSMECETVSCRPRSLVQDTRDRDVPRTTLIKGTKLYNNVHVLCGQCPDCDARYYADHESAWQDKHRRARSRFYLNSAKYLKIGQSLWVDRVFSSSVVNGTYSFHASSSAFAEFWNESFWKTQEITVRKVTRRQTWHAFVQETIRNVAKSSQHTLELPDGLGIEDLTKCAFQILGENGVIRSAENHFCSECTHDHKGTADRITGEDPAAIVGVDENRNVPVLTGEHADLAARDAAEARFNAQNVMEVDEDPDSEKAPVKLVVVDGIVTGPTVSADNYYA
jgi:CxC5 like cysteine cluster associated with KDZ transposases